jgi:hypothetical protein
MLYSKNFINELQIMGIPNIYFTNNLNLQKNFSTDFQIPFFNKESFISRNLCYIFSYLIRDQFNFFSYNLFIIKENLNPSYKDKIKSIYNKLEYLKKKNKTFEFFNIFLYKYFYFLKNINNIEKINFFFSNFLIKFFGFQKKKIPMFYKFFQKKHKKYFLQKNLCVFTLNYQKAAIKLNFLSSKLYNKKISM